MTGYMGADVPANIPGAKVLQKPFDPDDLLAAIDTILADRKVEVEAATVHAGGAIIAWKLL